MGMRFASLPWPRSLTTQLLCTYTAALLLTICAANSVLWLRARPDVGVATDEQLERIGASLRIKLQFDSTGAPRIEVPINTEWEWMFRDFSTDLKYRVLDSTGRVVLSSDNQVIALTAPDRLFESMGVPFAGVEGWWVRTDRVVHGGRTYYVQVGITKRFSLFVRTLTARVRASEAIKLALLSVVLVTIAVYFTLRRVLRPLRRTSEAVTQIDAHNLSQRLSTQNLPTEFLPVVTAFNQTLDRLEKGYLVQRAFLADAAHELKTPLALIRAQVELEGMTDRQSLLQDIDQMARQVNQLLHLAEASETQNYALEPVDVATLAEDVVGYLSRLAERHQVHVEVVCAQATPSVPADRGALFMLLKNLVENAIQHSPVGGGVVVSVAADHFSVSDEGPGIDPEDLPKLFKRFWRGPRRRSEGAGLGLSICAEIAGAHGWGIRVGGGGEGAVFFVSFEGAVGDVVRWGDAG